tara:strand:- start:377 stop:676 length:300 start_codon:yes stop_codon:yes gene_type:complete
MDTVTKHQWSLLAELGPINPQTMRKYHPSTLEKVWTGKRKNAFLSMWLNQKLEDYAKNEKGTRNTKGKGIRRKSLQFHESQVTELSKLTEAIHGAIDSD